MLDQLKRFAMQKMAEKMLNNTLGANETNAAAEEGANGLMNVLQGALAGGGAGGGLSQITDLLSNNGNSVESNGIFDQVKGNLLQTLIAKGMPQAEAEQEASNVSSDLLNGLAQKFQSPAQEDAGFDLGALTQLAGGNAGGILGAASKLFGK